MPDVDVVIPTFARPAALIKCLDALRRQSFQDFSVIVVDDASPTVLDGTLRARFEAVMDVRWLRLQSNSGPAAARNAGVAAGTAPLICFVDDDVRASPGLLAAHRRAVTGGGDRKVVSIGPLRGACDWKPTVWNRWEARTLEREYDRMINGVYAPTWRQLFTGNAMMRRENFEAVGGFDARYKRAEDIELGYRLWRSQCEFVFSRFAIGWHYAERSLDSWMRIPKMYAEADYAMSLAYPDLDWLEIVDKERSGATGRLSDRVAKLGVLGRGIRMGSVSVARGLDKIGAHSVATPLLSMAFNIGYRQGRMGVDPDVPLHGSKPDPLANR